LKPIEGGDKAYRPLNTGPIADRVMPPLRPWQGQE